MTARYLFGMIMFPIFLSITAPIFTFLIQHPNVINNIYIKYSMIVPIVIIIILMIKKSLNQATFTISIMTYIICMIPITVFIMHNKIYNISIQKFGIPPKCINIDINGDFRHPHALVKKDGKYYYWSFRENDFIENNRIQGC